MNRHLRRKAGRQIVLFVEGDTELAVPEFLRRWLDQQLPGHRVGISAVPFRGINQYINEIGKRVELTLERTAVDVAIGIVDLYGLPDQLFPGGRPASVDDRILTARKQIAARIPASLRARFYQHFAVHEVEAWLLAYPTAWRKEIRKHLRSAEPETVNHQEPPSKLLRRLLPGEYHKTTDARRVLLNADPQIAIDCCPNLKKLTDDLLAIARALQ